MRFINENNSDIKLISEIYIITLKFYYFSSLIEYFLVSFANYHVFCFDCIIDERNERNKEPARGKASAYQGF